MHVSARFRLAVLALASSLTVSAARPAAADSASAEAEFPATREPFFLVTTTTTTASAFDDLARRPEYAVYADGTFLVQKSDGRLWMATLAKAEVVEFLRFVLEDAKFPDIDMRYVLASPITTFTQFSLKTRSGSYSARRRAASLVGIGTKSGEKSLAAVESKLIALAERAQSVYAPGVLLVVARRTSPGDATPTWTVNDRVPFASLVDAADVERKTGTVLMETEADAVRTALAQGPEWRFGSLGAELRARPALPHERPAPTSAGPAPARRDADAIPTPATPAMGEELPKPPPMPVAPVAPVAPPIVAPPPPVAPTPPPAVAAPTSSDWRDDDLDFAGVQKLFVDLKRKASGSPHGSFWTKGYEEFVAFEFAILSGSGGKIRMIEPGQGKASNLVKALRGEAMTIRMPDGSTRSEGFPVMPPKGAPVSDKDLERLVRWIDHGAPKDRPSPAGTPSAPSVSPPSPAGDQPPTPAPTPIPAAEPAPASTGALEWSADDVDYAGVQKIFVDLNRKTSGSPHGKFWTKSYEEFFAFEFNSPEGKIRLFDAGKGAESNLVRALRGQPLIVRAADGTTREQPFSRMPPKGAPVPEADIERVRRWIDHGAPKERPTAATPVVPTSTAAPKPTEFRALTVVGSDTAKLGTEGPAEDGGAKPRAFVATSAAEWDAIFTKGLPEAGAHGTRVANALKKLLLDTVKGYDFAAAPLLLLVGPVTDNYAVELPTTLSVHADGRAFVNVSARHDDRRYASVPELGVWWAVLRVDGACPTKIVVGAGP